MTARSSGYRGNGEPLRNGLTRIGARKMRHGPVSEDNAGPSYGPLLHEPSVYLTDCILTDRAGNRCSSAPQVRV